MCWFLRYSSNSIGVDMGSVRPAEKVQQVVESFCAANAASEDVFFCYKFGRYQDIFPEKPYFLLSHCTSCFSVANRGREQGRAVPGNRRPTAFLAGLDFDGLRYTDYKRRILHADSMEEHWRNETQWFELWMRILEHLDSTGTNAYQEFARPILAHMTQGDVLEDKSLDKTRKAFGQFMRTDAAGRVMLRTLTVLDELMRGIVHCVAWLDPKTHLLDQVTLIAGLLEESAGPWSTRRLPRSVRAAEPHVMESALAPAPAVLGRHARLSDGNSSSRRRRGHLHLQSDVAVGPAAIVDAVRLIAGRDVRAGAVRDVVAQDGRVPRRSRPILRRHGVLDAAKRGGRAHRKHGTSRSTACSTRIRQSIVRG